MRRFAIIAAALALSLAAAGCNWSDLDAEFIAAMPEPGELHVRPPTETAQVQQRLGSGDLGQSQSALEADAFLKLDDTAKQLNAVIDGLTGGLDLVRRLPPSKREANQRTWGPWDDQDHPGTEMRVVIGRTILEDQPDQYSYSVEWRAKGSEAAFERVIVGTFSGEKAKGGTGAFSLDMVKAREVHVAEETIPGQEYEIQSFGLGYSHPEGGVKVDLDELVVELKTGTEVTFHFSHQRNSDESGEFSYAYRVLDKGWTLGATAKWLPSHAGRVDGTFTVGGSVVATHTECWDENLQIVYRKQDHDCGITTNVKCVDGRVEDCRL